MLRRHALPVFLLVVLAVVSPSCAGRRYDPPPPPPPPPKPWALTGAAGRAPNMIRSLLLEDGALEAHNLHLQDKYRRIAAAEVRCEEHDTEGCELLAVAYGTCARIVKGAMPKARRRGLKVGLLRPITLWPFPGEAIRRRLATARGVLVVEMSAAFDCSIDNSPPMDPVRSTSR